MTAADLVGTAEHDSPLAKALAAFQAEMPTVPKTKTANAGTFSYQYADLADIVAAAMPVMGRHGLSFYAAPRWTEHGLELVGVLLHASGESAEGALPIGGNTPQALGSSITYARRYLFGCMTGVVTDDDDDGHAASKPAPRKKAAVAAPSDTTPAPGGVTPKQITLIGTLMSQLGMKDRDKALEYVTGVVGRPIATRNDLSLSEARKVIDALEHEGVPDPVDPWAAPQAAGPADEPPVPTDPAPQPYRPGTRVSPGTAKRMDRILDAKLGTDAHEGDRAETMSTILGRRVETTADLTTAEMVTLTAALTDDDE